jgi:hypothetical protein
MELTSSLSARTFSSPLTKFEHQTAGLSAPTTSAHWDLRKMQSCNLKFAKPKTSSLPQRLDTVRKASTDWQVYRTRFLVKAKQLTEPLVFTDALGREHQGDRGDYLVESADGSQRIAPKDIFEDIYVAMGPANDNRWPPLANRKSMPELSRRRPVISRALFV